MTLDKKKTLDALKSTIVQTDQTNTFDTKQTFTHQASNAGIALAAVAGDVTSPNDGEFWYNLTTNKFRVRENGVTVDMIVTGGTVKQIFATNLIFTSTAATRTSFIFGDVVKATDADAQIFLNSAITAIDNTIFLDTNSKTSTITFALNDDGVDVLQISTTSGQTGEFSASGSVVVAAGSLINFTEDGGTSVGQLDYSMTLEYTR